MYRCLFKVKEVIFRENFAESLLKKEYLKHWYLKFAFYDTENMEIKNKWEILKGKGRII